MAATEKQNIWPYSASGNTAPRKVKRKLAASQGIFMPGCPFYVSTSGTLKRSDTADGTGDTYHFIAAAGVSAEQSANTEISGYLIDTDTLWCVMIENNGTDAAATQALVGNQYGLKVSTTAGQIGYTTLDVNNANACVEVVDIWPNVCPSDPNYGTTSDAPGIAIVRFRSSVINVTRA